MQSAVPHEISSNGRPAMGTGFTVETTLCDLVFIIILILTLAPHGHHCISSINQ
jgi:hypothetical protein